MAESTPPIPPAPPQVAASTSVAICPQCHQPVLPTYYFCPNCGKKLAEAPLSTSVMAQAGLYAFSAILPVICYLAIGYWQGLQYMRSADAKAKQIGMIALAILILSSAISFWIGAIWIQNTISSALTGAGSINSSMNGL